MDLVRLGNTIIYYRKKNKMTQTELSKKVGISRVVLSYYENGTREITLSKLSKIAEVLGVATKDLMTYDTSKPIVEVKICE